MSNELQGWELPLSAIKKLAPKADPIIQEMISENLVKWGPKFGLTSKQDIHEFIAQLLEESAYLTRFEENLNYTSAARLMKVWSSRFKTASAAAPYVKNPQRLANFVYANRMGNGPPKSGDGYRFRGRGGLMSTGREMFGKVSRILDFDFVKNPDALADPVWALPSALAVAQILKLGEVDGIEADTRRLNGGLTNIDNRRLLLSKVKKLLP